MSTELQRLIPEVQAILSLHHPHLVHIHCFQISTLSDAHSTPGSLPLPWQKQPVATSSASPFPSTPRPIPSIRHAIEERYKDHFRFRRGNLCLYEASGVLACVLCDTSALEAAAEICARSKVPLFPRNTIGRTTMLHNIL